MANLKRIWRHVSEDEVAHIKRLIAEGKTRSQICFAVKRSHQSLNHVIKNNGLDRPRPAPRRNQYTDDAAWADVADYEVFGGHPLSQYETAPLTHALAYPGGVYRGK